MTLTPSSGGYDRAGRSRVHREIVATRTVSWRFNRSAGGKAGTRRLIGLTVTPDRAPIVRASKPGRDMLLPDGNRSVSVTVEAEDDLALSSLRLTYTKVSGSGENFEFAGGDVPVALTRTSDRQWAGTAEWPLAALKLEPGDMVVYRGVAADRRPGATPVESDAFILEIAAPGSCGRGSRSTTRIDTRSASG
jgi:hypothetical protein